MNFPEDISVWVVEVENYEVFEKIIGCAWFRANVSSIHRTQNERLVNTFRA